MYTTILVGDVNLDTPDWHPPVIAPPLKLQPPLWWIYHDLGAIVYLSTKLERGWGYDGKCPKFWQSNCTWILWTHHELNHHRTTQHLVSERRLECNRRGRATENIPVVLLQQRCCWHRLMARLAAPDLRNTSQKKGKLRKAPSHHLVNIGWSGVLPAVRLQSISYWLNRSIKWLYTKIIWGRKTRQTALENKTNRHMSEELLLSDRRGNLIQWL